MNTILIVDDSPTNLKSITAILEGRYQTVPAKSGLQALKICERRLPDLVLMDVDMPVMDGFETVKLLHSNPRTGHVPVIFLTADHDSDTEIKALKCGAGDFITKPFEGEVLTHRIEIQLRLSNYRRQLQNTVKTLEDGISVYFSELIECRDENTGGHVRRTSRYFRLLGQALMDRGLFSGELTGRDLEMMSRAAPLHDIGKIGISDLILLKPGRLTDEEFTAIREHPAIGAQILGQMCARLPQQRHLLFARVIAECHHERFDGKGYPHGLKGPEIPLCARIMSVVDVYDALVMDRVYRRALTHEQARAIIAEGRGAAFDPLLADVFEEIHESFRPQAGAGEGHAP